MSEPSDGFSDLCVAAFESRRAEEMARMIERFGGRPRVSPSMREVAIADNPQAVDFAHRLIGGEIDVVIFMTGVGIRHLMAAVERHVPRQRFLDAVSDVTSIARGPKPVAVLRELGLAPTHRVAAPNTWREILQLVDASVPVANQTLGLVEYGVPNASLVAGLEARGATVVTVKVYDWDLPEDTGPLADNVRAIIAGEVQLAMFTSSQQVINLIEMARRMRQDAELRRAFQTVVVASIGPTTSQTLRESELPVDLEPEHAKMGHLVSEAATRAPALFERKRRVWQTLQSTAVRPSDRTRAPWYDSPFMKACRREPPARVPIWLMRQAGRYLPEYRAIREKTTFLELCKDPALSAEVMIATVKRLGVDAAIIFSDLLPILEPMGFDLQFAAGEGPMIHNPLREPGDVDRVVELESVEALDFVMQTVKLTRAALPSDLPLIGFAGAPFTLASYAIEGGTSRAHLHTKTLMYRDEGAWNALLARLARAIARYLNAQLQAGAQAVQIFDSWVGCLGPSDYRRYVLPHMRALIEQISPGAPVIHFATGNSALLPLLSEAGGTVIGVDWRVSLDEAWRQIGAQKAIQGNLDPTVLLAPREEIRSQARRILCEASGRHGHIFNLGHGVLPQTPVDGVLALIDAVHEIGPLRP